MHTTSEAKTFSDSNEILARLIGKSQWTANYLRALKSHTQDERRNLLLENLIKLQTELSRSLHDYRDMAPDEVLHTFSQYAREEHSEPLNSPGQIDDIVNKTLILNQEIRDEVAYLAEKDNSPPIQEVFQNLQDLVDAKLRDISMSAQTIRDM